MVNDVEVTCARRNKQGRHLVTVKIGSLHHKHRFDVDDQFQRRQFRDAVVSKFDFPDDAHEWLEQRLITAAAAADSNGDAQLWTPNTLSIADVQEKPVRWFWHHYMPEGAYTVIDADPNEGKSTIAIDIAARYTRGDAMPPHSVPDGTRDSGNVLLLSAEDDLQRTVKPRLLAAGARIERVHFLRSVSIDGADERFIQLPCDVPVIERVVVAKQIGFIVVDVLSAFTQDGYSMNDEAAIAGLPPRSRTCWSEHGRQRSYFAI